MKKKVLKLAVLALIVGSISSCNKDPLPTEETGGNGTSQTALASDTLLGGIDVNEDTLFCNSYITVKEDSSTSTNINVIETEGNYNGFGNQGKRLILERDGSNLIINEGEDNKIRTSKSPRETETESTFTVERMMETITNLNETSIFSVDYYDVGDNATVEIVTLEAFNEYYAELPDSIKNQSTLNNFEIPENNDVILKIEIEEGDLINIKTKIGYYFYTRTL